ncbi:Ribonuclease P/MRP, subunit POP1 [Kalmanozyma brasiliensis GHG001]|uniref:Ribonuclease P/MRP, subunit POP1 n=1 Tax=Kalmanozyma brasiliensis (strain GHG001) TaxID=1365824 RepID=UPI002867F9A9|nr:Ribonuclease P/MRP, subunit POP1 [Kalmanozyma brasiliensis GHG001]EST04981.2 Ribonuclease P/MRP, subunit POP1 [Kalmanozyma brasiliensis GHG001]
MPAQKRPAPSAASSSKTPSAAEVADGQGPNWKKRKQERAHTARFIQTQSAAATSSSASSSRTVSKSSTPIPGHSSTTTASNLPTSIELESLVSSRAFQIQSFLRSIKSAKSATTTRAWQLLPRHARRRAASHNLLRLPSRLRSKALAELRSSTTQARSRSDIRKRLPSHGVIQATLRRKKLAERASHPQRRWLETHLWHAKRFRMTTEKGKGKERDQGTKYGRWGFVLPETTMMKSHRASWRSAREFVTVHDASYSSVFRLGARVAVSDGLSSDAVNSTLLGRLSDSLSRAGFANVLAFATDTSQSIRVLDTVLTHQGADPNHSSTAAALAPVRIVLLSGARCFSKSALVQDKLAYIRKEALVFAHPAADLHVRRALKAAGIIMVDEKKNGLFELVAPATNVVQTYASQLDSAPDPWLAAGGKDSSLSKLEKKRRRQAYRAGSAKTSITTDTNGLADSKQGSTLLDDEAELRRKQGYNIFELIGPRAAPLLQAVLRLAQGSSGKDDEIKLRRFLSKKDGTGTAMVEVRVNDPRLSYPPKLKPLSTDADASSEASKDTEEVKSDELFWMGAKPPRFSKGEIDSRRALNTISGSRLQPDSRDDAVPVVIVRDRVVQKPSVDRYTLIVPRGWGMAFFLSLVATHQSGASSGARVLGQHQLKHQRLELAALSSAAGTSKQGAEAGMLSYPHNWIGTQTYAVSEKEAALSGQEEWGRRPKGKRTEYLFPSHKDWQAFQQTHTAEQVTTKLARDRTGAARPYPFGGSRHSEWIVSNSERLFSREAPLYSGLAAYFQPWLVANAGISKVEAALSASSLASAMVAVKLHAIRKGTVMPLSSLMLASSFDDHLSWIQHLDPIDHPAAVINRNSTGGSKIDKQHLKTLIERRCEIMQLGRSAPATSTVSKRKDARIPADNAWSKYLVEASDPEELHDRSADWNNAIGTVLDGDYSLGNGKGFGIGAVTLRAWVEVLDRQRRIEALKVEDKGRRQPRNPVETTNLLLMREPGTSVVRAVSASVIPLM